jgi:hypothetical protein
MFHSGPLCGLRALRGDVSDGDGFVAVGTRTAEVQAGAGPVAVVTPLLTDVPGIALGTLIDGDFASGGAGRDHDRRRPVLMASAPSRLAAGGEQYA